MHGSTKKELARKTLEQGQYGKRVVVARSNQCQASHQDMHVASTEWTRRSRYQNDAVDATTSGATTIQIHSTDNDVLVLALRRYPQLCNDTAFAIGVGQRHRVFHCKPILRVFGEERAAALPKFHVITGADNTGSFVSKGMLTCWKIFY